MWHGRPASAALRLPPSGVLWLAPERTEPGQAADIGQAAPVAAFAPEIVGDTTPAVTVSDSLAHMPEWTSGDGAIDDRTIDNEATRVQAGDRAIGDDVDLAYAADDESPTAATDTDIDAGQVPSATDADAPHFPDEAPPEAVAHHAELLDTAPSAGVSADAPVVAPEVPEVEVAPLGTEADQVPPDAAAEDAPPAMEPAPGAGAVLDEPRSGSEVTETAVAVGGGPEGATPSATRPTSATRPADPGAPERNGSVRDDESSTHQ